MFHTLYNTMIYNQSYLFPMIIIIGTSKQSVAAVVVVLIYGDAL